MAQTAVLVSDIHGCGPEGQDYLETWAMRIRSNGLYSRTLSLYGAESGGAVFPRSLEGERMAHRFAVKTNGIEHLSQRLRESITEPSIVLGFSLGGTVAWHAAKANPHIRAIVALSSTRLRYETVPCSCPAFLIYGGHDAHRPNDVWVAAMGLFVDIEIIAGAGHGFYLDPQAHEDAAAVKVIRWLAKTMA